MSDDGLSIENTPSEADVAYIEERLHAFNIAATGYDDYRPLAVFARDTVGGLVAGLTGFTWGGTLRIAYLWVDDALRGEGYGARLMAAAEAEARARGCRQAVLETHSFQAPEFYLKLGYTQSGLTEDWPVGHQELHFQKRLG